MPSSSSISPCPVGLSRRPSRHLLEASSMPPCAATRRLFESSSMVRSSRAAFFKMPPIGSVLDAEEWFFAVPWRTKSWRTSGCRCRIIADELEEDFSAALPISRFELGSRIGKSNFPSWISDASRYSRFLFRRSIC